MGRREKWSRQRIQVVQRPEAAAEFRVHGVSRKEVRLNRVNKGQLGDEVSGRLGKQGFMSLGMTPVFFSEGAGAYHAGTWVSSPWASWLGGALWSWAQIFQWQHLNCEFI